MQQLRCSPLSFYGLLSTRMLSTAPVQSRKLTIKYKVEAAAAVVAHEVCLLWVAPVQNRSRILKRLVAKVADICLFVPEREYLALHRSNNTICYRSGTQAYVASQSKCESAGLWCAAPVASTNLKCKVDCYQIKQQSICLVVCSASIIVQI